MFLFGLWGGGLRIPALGVMLALTPFTTLLPEHKENPVPFTWIVALVTMMTIAGLGIAANGCLLGACRYGLKMGRGALAASVLSYLNWLYIFGKTAPFWMRIKPAVVPTVVCLLLLIRLAFLIAYAFALRRYRDWEQWRWY